jgi:LacI family transcriptional regulator
MITMKEIAESAGVSQATVSRVLSGSTLVSPAKRRAVMEWINKLGYTPNMSAQTLANKQSHLIGMIVPDMKNPFFFEVIDYLESEMKRHGYHLLVANTRGDENVERYHLQTLRARQIDGLIVVPTSENFANINKLKDTSISVVVLTQSHEMYDSICISHSYGGRLVANHLLSLGMQNVLLVGFPQDEKFIGFLEVYREKGIKIPEENYFDFKKGEQDVVQAAYDAVKEYFRIHAFDEISAIFAVNDLAAFGVLHAVKELGLDIPGEIAVVSFDDTFISKNSFPALTSVSQPLEEMARIAVELIIDRFHNGSAKKPVHLELKPSLLVRESSVKTN